MASLLEGSQRDQVRGIHGRVQRSRLVQLRQPLFRTASIEQQVSEVVVVGSRERVNGDRSPRQFDGFLEITHPYPIACLDHQYQRAVGGEFVGTSHVPPAGLELSQDHSREHIRAWASARLGSSERARSRAW